MNPTYALALASIRSTVHTLRSIRVRLLFLVLLAGIILLNVVEANWLGSHLGIGQAQPGNIVVMRLWLLVGVSWITTFFLSFLVTYQNWLHPSKAMPLFLTPLPSKTMFRTIYLVTLIVKAGPRLLIFIGG